MFTKQEIFDKVATHLLTQLEKSIEDGARCMYRSPDGLKCAIGCLIPDNQYDCDMEGKSVYEPAISAVLSKAGYPVDRAIIYLYHDLQRIHDVIPVENWRAALKSLAFYYDLEWKHDE